VDLQEAIERRSFLKSMAAAGTATMAMGSPRNLPASEGIVQPEATADSCILIWIAR